MGLLSLRVSAFGTTPLSGAGTLLNLRFDLIGPPNACSNLTWVSFRFNEGIPCATPTNGRVCIIPPSGSIAGTVSYCISPKAVPGVVVTAAGAPPKTSTTNSSGNYQLTELGSGSYTVTPTKTGDISGNNSITSFDASLVAQCVVGIKQCTSCEQLAGDASNNGNLTSFDASLIAQTAAGIANSGIAGTWKFVPPNRGYPSVTGNLTNQNFDAVLVGDVSGNWAPSATGLPPIAEARAKLDSETAQVAISLPAASGMSGSSVTIPITVGNLTGRGYVAYDFDLTFNNNVLQLQNPPIDAAGTLSSAMNITPNATTPGRLRVSAFGTAALAGAGTLLNLKFNVVGAPGTSTDLTWQRFLFNEEAQTNLVNGRFTVASQPTLPPTVTTAAASSITSTSATLNGGINPNGLTTNIWFEWGTSSTLASFNSTPMQAVGSGTTSVAVSANSSGLTAGTTYYFRLVGVNSAGTARSAILSFTTLGGPPNPAPRITSLSPSSAIAGGAGFTLTVNGQDFVNGAEVRWNGSPRPTTFVTSTQLTAAIPVSDIVAAGTATVAVFSPTPGGGLSNALSFTITANPTCDLQWRQSSSGLYGGVIWAFAVSGTTLFAGTEDGGVFQSSDNGQNWTQDNNGLTNTSVYALAVSGTTLFAGTYDGVYRSSDNGQNWTAVNNGLTATDVRALAVNGTTLFAGTNGGGVFRSSDNGQNWTAVNNGLTDTVVFALVVSGTTLFAGTFRGGVFRSSDNGQNWTQVNNGLAHTFVFALAVSGTTLFAGTFGGGVFAASLSNCSCNISPNNQSFGASGGASNVSVTATAGCAWTAVSNASWIAITSGASGSGNGTVSYSVLANTGSSQRTGTMTIAGQTFTVTQAGANNPTPILTSLNPSSTTAGGGAFTLTVNGADFVVGAVVRWNGSDRATSWVSSTQLTATITAADIATAGTANVTVFNPSPGGGPSNPVSFAITSPLPPCMATVPSDRWRGEYFNNRVLSGAPAMVRDEGAGFINFNWGAGSPSIDCGISVDNFSARLTRTVNFAAGVYRFTVAADDGVRLYIDGALKLDKWFDQSATTYTVDVFLAAGHHTIRLEYYENGGLAVAELSWGLLGVTAANRSTFTLCAEEDNVNIPLTGRITSFVIEATHPTYPVPPDNCGPDFSNCPPAPPGFPFTPGVFKLFDDGETVVEAVREASWWRPNGMAAAVDDRPQVMDIHYVRIYRRIDGTSEYPQILVLYQDGNLRLIPQPPIGANSVCFGSSVIIGPAAPALRPFAEIVSVTYSSRSQSLEIRYRDGGSAIIILRDVNRNLTRVQVNVNYPTDTLPFATFRSMFVADGNADVDHVRWMDAAGVMRDDPIMTFTGGEGTEWFFGRQTRSRHNTSAPGIRIRIE